jgi:hypothetical protein
MERAEVDRIVKAGLASNGILAVVDRDKSQLLEFPEEYFVEIVLSDGSKLDEAERILQKIQSDLGDREVRLDSIVRATWRVRDAQRAFDAGWIVDSSRPGGVLSLPILRFKVTLESGSRQTDVWVDVTPGGYEQLKHAGQADERSLKKAVADFVAIQLSVGGTSYWDPIRYPRQELNEAAALYTLHRTPAVPA